MLWRLEDMGKFISGQQAATMIKDGASVWLSGGGGGINDPDCLLKNIEDHFLETGHPADLIFYHSAGIGNKMEEVQTALPMREWIKK